MGSALLLGALFLLAIVLFPGVGHAVNGSMRWISLGVFSIQVSELAKFAIVIYMASYLCQYNSKLQMDLSAFLKPMGILAVVAILLLKEPDFGTAVVIMITVLGMMFLAGMRLRHFL